MDERVKLTRKVDGNHVIRVTEADLAVIGRHGLEAELTARNLHPGDLGEAKYDSHRMRWEIPVRVRGE